MKYVSTSLILAAKNNDEMAFIELLDHYRPLIWSLFKQRPHWLSADDWFQECTILLFEVIQQLEEEDLGALTTYFQVCCKRKLWKIRTRYQYRPLETCESIMEEQVVSYGNARESHLALDYKMCLQDGLATLSKRHQHIYQLKLAGYNSFEISRMFDCAPSTVRFKLREIRQIMKERYPSSVEE
ncbi:MAG: sigma-70 family RNA polymerase sigma factor [Lactobacillaceae bacterium]|jgi:RNA polymerase sigma factor (sigma-70 family)|nr:sigma-70 family RNA polymerase sigma factor [Lactobacillaceae bacterium]